MKYLLAAGIFLSLFGCKKDHTAGWAACREAEKKAAQYGKVYRVRCAGTHKDHEYRCFVELEDGPLEDRNIVYTCWVGDDDYSAVCWRP